MRTSPLFFCLLLFFALLPIFFGTPVSRAQGACPGEALYVDLNNGQDTPACGPDGQPPCRTVLFAVEQIGDCRQPLQIVDSNTNQVLYLANLKQPAPWGQVIGLVIGLASGIALGYFWRKSRTTNAAAAFMLAAALWLLLGSARPAAAQGACPGSAVNFRNIGANTPVCAARGNPCKTLNYSQERAQQCANATQNEVRVFRKRVIGWKLVDIARPQPVGFGNQPCDEGWAGFTCRLKSFFFMTEDVLEPTMPVLLGLLVGIPLGALWHRARAART